MTASTLKQPKETTEASKTANNLDRKQPRKSETLHSPGRKQQRVRVKERGISHKMARGLNERQFQWLDNAKPHACEVMGEKHPCQPTCFEESSQIGLRGHFAHVTSTRMGGWGLGWSGRVYSEGRDCGMGACAIRCDREENDGNDNDPDPKINIFYEREKKKANILLSSCEAKQNWNKSKKEENGEEKKHRWTLEHFTC